MQGSPFFHHLPQIALDGFEGRTAGFDNSLGTTSGVSPKGDHARFRLAHRPEAGGLRRQRIHGEMTASALLGVSVRLPRSSLINAEQQPGGPPCQTTTSPTASTKRACSASALIPQAPDCRVLNGPRRDVAPTAAVISLNDTLWWTASVESIDDPEITCNM